MRIVRNCFRQPTCRNFLSCNKIYSVILSTNRYSLFLTLLSIAVIVLSIHIANTDKKRDICQWLPEACWEAIVTTMGSTMSMHMTILMIWKRCMKDMMPECMTTVMTTVITWWKRWWCNTARYDNMYCYFKQVLNLFIATKYTPKIFLSQNGQKYCLLSWIMLLPKTRNLWN